MTRDGEVESAAGPTLRYLRRPGREPHVIVPAASWLAEDLDDLAPGRDVTFYDLRGRGRSDAVTNERELGLEHDVGDLERLMDALGIERAALLGWSYHGALAARFALARPDRVERLVLVGPIAPVRSPYFEEFLDGFARRADLDDLTRLDALKRSGAKESQPEAYCRAVHAAFFGIYVANRAALGRMRSSPCVEPNLDADRVNDQGRRVVERLGSYDWRAELARLERPVLIVHGTADPVPIAGSEEWQRCLPDARLVALEGVGHMPWLESPEAFHAAVEPFLAAS